MDVKKAHFKLVAKSSDGQVISIGIRRVPDENGARTFFEHHFPDAEIISVERVNRNRYRSATRGSRGR